MTNILSAEQNAQAKRSPANKTHVSYWKKRIFQPVYIRDGQKITSPNFCIEIQHAGERRRWSLGPGTREVAAARARQIYLHLITHGWASTIERFKPQSAPKVDCSIGDFLLQFEKTSDLAPRTRVAYITALRKIVADAFGLADDNRKYGQGRGHRQWVERVDAVRLRELTPAKIQEWKISFINRAGTDPVALRSAKTSANSYLRSAKSLFSPKVIEHLGDLKLPSPLPFSSVSFEPRQSCRYRSTFSITELLEAARTELANDAECFKALLLGAFCGLRRGEIDSLQWDSFLWDQNLIRIQPTQFFAGKSEDSLDDIAVEPELLALFRTWKANATGSFVLESDQAPRPGCLYRFYRSQPTFDRLASFLRSHGVTSKKPIHELRKQFGSEVCKHFGLFAASQALRHSDVKVTAEHYLENRVHSTVKLGHLLSPNIIEFKQAS